MIPLENHRKFLLHLVEKGELSVNEITDLVCTTKRNVSRMIKKLAEEGHTVSSRREGYFKRYYLSGNAAYRVDTVLTDAEIKALVSSQDEMKPPAFQYAVSKIISSAQPGKK